MKIKLSCIACGHSFELGDAYEDYEGEVRCWGCQTSLDIALREGKLRRMRRNLPTPPPPVPQTTSAPASEPEMAAPPAPGQEAR